MRMLQELEELKKKLAEVERERNEAQSQAARSIEEKAAAEKRANEAMEMAAKHEQELKEAKDAEARQQEAFNSKQDELQKALEEQKSASAAIKADADKAGLTLQQAQKELEGKMKRLEADLDAARHDDKEDEQKIAKLEEQLKGYTEKLDRCSLLPMLPPLFHLCHDIIAVGHEWNQSVLCQFFMNGIDWRKSSRENFPRGRGDV